MRSLAAEFIGLVVLLSHPDLLIFRPGLVEQRHFDGLLQEAEQALFLFLFVGAKEFHGMAADGTEFQNFPTATTQARDAIVAHDFEAMRTAMGNWRTLMMRTNHRAVGPDYRRGRAGDFEFRNADGNIGAFDEEFDFAYTESLAGSKPCFLNRFARDKGAIGRATISQQDFAVHDGYLTMHCRDGRMLNLEISLGTAAQAVDPKFEIKHPLIKAIRFKD